MIKHPVFHVGLKQIPNSHYQSFSIVTMMHGRHIEPLFRRSKKHDNFLEEHFISVSAKSVLFCKIENLIFCYISKPLLRMHSSAILLFISNAILTSFSTIDAFTASYRLPVRLPKPVTLLDSDSTAFESEETNNINSYNETDQSSMDYLLHESSSTDRPIYEEISSLTDEQEYTVVIDNDSDLDLRDGTLSFPDTLLVQGSLKVGKLRCTREKLNPKGARVKVAAGGYLGATLYCVEQVEIWGEMHGNIHCETLLLGPEAVVEGNIEAKFLQVMGGASINGSIKTGKTARDFDPRKQDKIIIESQKKSLGEMAAPLTIIQEVTKRRATDPIIFTQNGTQRMSANEFYKPRKDSLDGLFGTVWRNASIRGDILSSSGKYLDSFGNPLIVEADEETVNSFREVRRFSHETRTLLDAHLRKKEKDKVLRLSAMKNHQSSRAFGYKRITADDSGSHTDEQSEDEEKPKDDQSGQMPTFMR